MAWFGITEVDPQAFDKILELLPRLAKMGVYPHTNELTVLLSAINIDVFKLKLVALKAHNTFRKQHPDRELQRYSPNINDEFRGDQAQFVTSRKRTSYIRKHRTEGYHYIFRWAVEHSREAA